MKYKRIMLITLSLTVFLSSCSKASNNKNETFASENLNDSEVVTYQVERGKVDTASFQFEVPGSYVVDSTTDYFSIKNKSNGITITIEENKDPLFDPDEYIGMLRQQFSNLGIAVDEDSPVVISGVETRKIHIAGLSKTSENESMHCYVIPASYNYLIVTAALKQDTKDNVREAEKIIKQIVVK